MAMRLHYYSMQSGVALVMVLWLMTVLSAVALGASLLSQLRLKATRNSGDAVRALFLARAGVERAIADLKKGRDSAGTLDELLEDAERVYHNVELGGGTYTLLAEFRQSAGSEPEYGVSDEAAKINLNTADEQMLASLPGIDPDLAADIVALRREKKKIYDLGDLLLIERFDPLVLYGEDQNQNGIVDPNEDDGDESWPPDNQDGLLERGLAAYLTCYSAARNVTIEGKKRVDINKASAQDIMNGVPGINQQQAESIVEHRKNRQFSSIADLLDVMLVEKQPDGGDGEKDDSEGGVGGKGRSRSSGSEAKTNGARTQTRTTQKKAFNLEQFKAIADLVTTTDKETLEGVININTAPAEVLACLPGVDEALAQQICARRGEASFKSIAELLDVQGMTTARFKQICSNVSARSDVFSVRSFGVVGWPGGSSGTIVYCCVAAVIDRTGDEVKLKSWRELR